MNDRVVKNPNFKNMEYVEVSPADAYEAIALFEALEPDTLAFIELPRCVYVGSCNLPQNVNLQYCRDNNIPVVRGIAKGRSVSYQGNDNLWVIFSIKEPMSLDVLKDILIGTFRKLGLDIFIQDNDVRVGDRRIAMYDFSEHRFVLEICLSADFEEINKTLRFPPEKWRGKPVSKIEDWLLPLSGLLGPTAREAVKVEIISQVENALGVELTSRDLKESELVKVASLSEKYHSGIWTRYEKWSPIKDYWRPE